MVWFLVEMSRGDRGMTSLVLTSSGSRKILESIVCLAETLLEYDNIFFFDLTPVTKHCIVVLVLMLVSVWYCEASKSLIEQNVRWAAEFTI